MGVARSSYYATPVASDAELVIEMRAIADAWECYGYRRIGAELSGGSGNLHSPVKWMLCARSA